MYCIPQHGFRKGQSTQYAISCNIGEIILLCIEQNPSPSAAEGSVYTVPDGTS